MKLIVFGSSGKLGSDLVQGFKNQKLTSFYLPSSTEVDLIKSADVNQYISDLRPNIVIQAAQLRLKEKLLTKVNLETEKQNWKLNKNVFTAVSKIKDCIYFDISSARIYENFPAGQISENHFSQLSIFPPVSSYAILKAKQSKNVEKQVQKGSKWYSLILPHVIPLNSVGSLDELGLFDGISYEIFKSKIQGTNYKIPKNFNLQVVRQFVNGIDVARFCMEVIEKKFEYGILHLPNLPFINLRDFIESHDTLLESRIDLNCEEPNFLKPRIISKRDKVTNFKYLINRENLVEKLAEKYYKN